MRVEISLVGLIFHPNRGCGYQSLTTDALKRLIDQLEKKILQIDQSKITVKHL